MKQFFFFFALSLCVLPFKKECTLINSFYSSELNWPRQDWGLNFWKWCNIDSNIVVTSTFTPLFQRKEMISLLQHIQETRLQSVQKRMRLDWTVVNCDWTGKLFTYLMSTLSSNRPEPATVNMPLTATENGLVNVTIATWCLRAMIASSSATWTKQTVILITQG